MEKLIKAIRKTKEELAFERGQLETNAADIAKCEELHRGGNDHSAVLQILREGRARLEAEIKRLEVKLEKLREQRKAGSP